MRARTLAALMAALLIAWPSAAQETRGSIEGVVRDTTGAVLPGVTVEAKGVTVAGGQTAVTDAAGVYRFPSLPPGVYEVVASLTGFTPARSENVQLQLGQILKVDLALAIAGVAESVQVTAESPLIDVKQNTAGTNIEKEFIDRIPKGRDFTSVVTQAPGANNEVRGGGISIDGASGSENRYFIDGVDTTNLRTGISGKNLLTEFVEEIQVKSSGYPAEFGGATGGVVNVITKSGTNQFRGDVGSYFTNEALYGKARPTLRLVLTGANAAEYVTFPKDDYSRWEPFGQIGGPLVRDKVWFYGGYTPQLEDISRTVTFRTNSQTGTFNSEETTHNVSGNLTAQISRTLRARGSVNYGEFHRRGRLPNIDGTSNPTVNFAEQGQDQPNLGTNVTIDYVPSNRLFLNAKANYLSYDTQDIGIPSDIRYLFTESNAGIPGVPPDLVRARGYSNLLTNSASVKDLYQRIGASADATFYADAAGQHTFKGGIQFERVRNDVFNAEQAPNIQFYWAVPHTNLDGTIHNGTYGTYSWRQFGTIGDVHVNNVGLFIQDNWTVNNRLTINLGLRTEREEAPSYVEGLAGIKFDFSDKVAPRAGFAYDMKGDGRWKLFGSWGVFYDIMKLELPRGAFGGDKWIESYYTLDTVNWPTIGPSGNFPGRFLEAVNFRIPSNDPSCPECGAIDPDLKPMRQQEAVFGLEHELAPRVSVGARYVHKQLDRAIEDVGVIVPGIGEVFYIANPGEGVATHIIGEEFPALPKAVRDYDALELKVTKRFSNRWSANASYTLSRLYGNYSGLASSDENGRNAPNVNRFFDSIVMAFDDNAQPVFGRLNTDRPHQLKLTGAYQLPTETTIGAVFFVASGIPVSRTVNMQSSTPVFYLGRTSDGRTPVFNQLDLQVQQGIRLPGNTRADFIMNVLNVFDRDEAVDVFRGYTRDTIAISDEAFFAGFNMDQLIAAQNRRLDPRFLMAGNGVVEGNLTSGLFSRRDGGFQEKRSIRFGLRFTF